MTKPPGEIQTDDTRHHSVTFFWLLETASTFGLFDCHDINIMSDFQDLSIPAHFCIKMLDWTHQEQQECTLTNNQALFRFLNILNATFKC